jgi:hypothetical protein
MQEDRFINQLAPEHGDRIRFFFVGTVFKGLDGLTKDWILKTGFQGYN